MACYYCARCVFHCTCSDMPEVSDAKVLENVRAWVLARNSSSNKRRPDVQFTSSLRLRDEQRTLRAHEVMKNSTHIKMVTDLPFRSCLYSYHGSTYIGMGGIDKKLCYLLAKCFFEGFLKPTGNKTLSSLYKDRKLREGAKMFETAPIQVLVMCSDARVEGIRKVGSVDLGSPGDDSVPVLTMGNPSDVGCMKAGQVLVLADRDIVGSVNDVDLVSKYTPYQETYRFRERGDYSELMVELELPALGAKVTVNEGDVLNEDTAYLAFLKEQHSRNARAMLLLNLDQRGYKDDNKYLCLRHGTDIGRLGDEDYDVVETRVLKAQLLLTVDDRISHWRFTGRSGFEVQERLRVVDRLIRGEVDVKKVAETAVVSTTDVLLALDGGWWGVASPDTACYAPLAKREVNGMRFKPLRLAEVIGITVLADADGRLWDRLGRSLRATELQGCIHLAQDDGTKQARFDRTVWDTVRVNGSNLGVQTQ